MDLALALLVLWFLLFVPVGLLLHWLVLGAGARTRALPLAPITGMAVAFIALSALRAGGVRPGDPWVEWMFVVAAVVSALAVWRLKAAWRSRELIGLGFLLLLAVALVQVPVLGDSNEGPLGYGTPSSPVTEVATIEAGARGDLNSLETVRAADHSSAERFTGFEQFAALSVALGQSDGGAADVGGSDGTVEQQLQQIEDSAHTRRWSSYTLHAPIAGMLAALVLLPLFAFARARGVRWFGLMMLVPLGVLAPAIFVALATGEGAAVASVPFVSAAAFSLLVTRRDRGWWALVALYSGAVVVSVGPLGLLPIICFAGAWQLLRSGAYEHLAQVDRPVSRARSVVVVALAAMLTVYAVAAAVIDRSELSWTRLHSTLLDAVVSWPFTWLGTNLAPTVPESMLEIAIWVLAPALLAVATIYAIVRNERRELSVLAGALAAVLVAMASVLLDRESGIALVEYVLLVTSPLLAVMVVRAVALARSNAEDQKSGSGTTGKRTHMLAGVGPTLLVVAFAALSISATGVTGTRMVHAPALTGVQLEAGSTLVAAGDPWLAFVIDGERTTNGYADADELSSPRPLREQSKQSITFGSYRKVVLGSSPLASDPTHAYVENSALDPYAARLFYDRRSELPVPTDIRVDGPLNEQRQASSTNQVAGSSGASTRGAAAAPAVDASADLDGAASPPTPDDTADAVADAEAADAADVTAASQPAETFETPLVHTPVETSWSSPAAPAGLLVPPTDVDGCSTRQDVPLSCKPTQPELGPGCGIADREAARSELDASRDPGAAPAAGDATGSDDAPGSVVASGTGIIAAARRTLDGTSDPEPRAVTLRERDVLLPEEPTLLGVACFDVELAGNATALLVHLRDVGLVLGAEQAVDTDLLERTEAASGADAQPDAARGSQSPWTRTREGGGVGGVAGGYTQHGSKIGSSLTYGKDRLTGGFDLVMEGAFGAGVTIGNPTQPDVPIVRINGSADGFGPLLRDIPLVGGVVVTNSAGTSVELGRMFARPRDLPRSCDMPLPLDKPSLREMQLVSREPGDKLTRPGFTVAIVDITTSADGVRTARVAVGNYMSRAGLPRYLMIDWTEQFERAIEIEGCDGTIRAEGRAEKQVAAGVQAVKDATEAFGSVR